MKIRQSRWARFAALLAVVGMVGACGAIPRPGPSKSQIYAGSVQRAGDAFVVDVNDRVTRATAVQPALGFTESFLRAGQVGSDTIQPGDTLGITIWENVDDGLLVMEGANAAVLEEVQVDGSGFIFIPYAGRIRAAGNSPEAIRRIITGKLEDQTPDPQVEVRRLAGDGATVSLLGDFSAQGVYPIERPTRTLSSMLSRAGGVAIPPEVAQVTVIRGDQSSKVWFQDIFRHPQFDIALRGGDKILVEEDSRAFTALGATGAQARVPFEGLTLSAIEAIARVGGLSATSADPTGVFILRNEPAEIANVVMGRDDLQGAQRLVYVLDLTRPNGMFMARDFAVRDGDTLYVTEAPFTQWSRVISALIGTLGVVDTFTATGDTLGF